MPMFAEGASVRSVIEGIRPLTVGAVYWDSFEFIAPKMWSSGVVLMRLFEALPMLKAGWTPETTDLTFLGDDIMGRTWRATRKRA